MNIYNKFFLINIYIFHILISCQNNNQIRSGSFKYIFENLFYNSQLY
jgi:hypothetical protein